MNYILKTQMKIKKGFIQIPLLIAAVVFIVTLSGAVGYGVFEYHKIFEIIREAEQLVKEERYNKAIEKLEFVQNRWLVKNLGIKRQAIANKIEKVERRTTERRIIEEEIKIPTFVAFSDEKLKNFLIDYKIKQRVGFISFQVIREDLNRDGLDEIIIGFTYGGPTLGHIGLIVRDDEQYKIINWEEISLGISEMYLRQNIPNDKHQSLVVKIAGGPGTGIFHEKMLVYTIINNQLKLTFNEFIERREVSRIGIINNYEIDFKDIDYDGNIEIIQKGIEREVEWSYKKDDFISTKEVSVKNVFKWIEEEKLFKKD